MKDASLTKRTGVDAADFRAALSRFATGIAVVTTRTDDDRRIAVTVNAFSSVSLEPPLVLFCLDVKAFHFEALASADNFAINILSTAQRVLSDRFALAKHDQFSDLATTTLATGCPILDGNLATLDCSAETTYRTGDHVIIIGHVLAVEIAAERRPLLYFASRYRDLKSESDG